MKNNKHKSWNLFCSHIRSTYAEIYKRLHYSPARIFLRASSLTGFGVLDVDFGGDGSVTVTCFCGEAMLFDGSGGGGGIPPTVVTLSVDAGAT